MKVKELRNKLNDIDENLEVSVEVLTDTTPDEYEHYSISRVEVCNFNKWNEKKKGFDKTPKLNIITKE